MLTLGGSPLTLGGLAGIVSSSGADNIAPTLTSPADAANGATASTGSVSTDEGNGTLYWVVSTSATGPSQAQVKAGQMHTGASAAASGSQSVSGTGVQTLSPTPSGLSGSTTYFTHFMHEDAAANQSAVASANGFTTSAGSAPVNTSLPVASPNTATQGQTVSVTNGSWSNSPTGYTYQWQRNSVSWSNISGATSSSYTMTASDVSLDVRCVVTATNAAGSTAANSNTVSVTGSSTFDPGTLLGPSSSITYRGVTWGFSNSVRYLLSANGDPVVITDSARLPSGTQITSITPASGTDSLGYIKNGAMTDPYDPFQSDGYSNQLGQGFDSAIDSGKASQKYKYTSDRNVDPGNTGQPITVNTGDAFHVVKAVRDPAKDPYNGDDLFIQKYVPLTFMNHLPPRPGTWFRPGIAATSMTWPVKSVEEMDFSGGTSSPLRNLTKPRTLSTDAQNVFRFSSAQSYRDDLETRQSQTLPFWSVTGEMGRRSYITGENATYARAVARIRAKYLCSLFMDPASSNPSAQATEQAARQELATYIIQWGLDVDGAHQAGQRHSNGAGQHFGYLEHMYFAGFMLGDSAIIGRAQRHYTNWVGLIFWVKSSMIGYPVAWDIGTAGDNSKRIGETYRIEMLGMPEWYVDNGWQDDDDTALTAPAGGIGDANASWLAPYRDTTWDNIITNQLPVLLLRNGPTTALENGVKAILRGGTAHDTDWLPAASIAYMDRSREISPWRDSFVSAHTGVSQDIYDAWRDTAPVSRWTGKPDVSASFDSTMLVFTPGASSGQINWNIAGWTYSTQTITDREISYSQDGVQFSSATSAGTSTSTTISGLRPQTLHWMRWRQENASGWGYWSPTWVQNHTAGNAGALNKTPRNRVRAAGTVSGTFTNTVAPALHYKPYPEHEMPYYEPVSSLSTDAVYGPSTSSIDTLYAGIGYWTGGTAANVINANGDGDTTDDNDGDLLTATYQWQRNTGGGFANIGGATSQSFDISGETSGHQIRCVVTVRTVSANSNSVTIP